MYMKPLGGSSHGLLYSSFAAGQGGSHRSCVELDIPHRCTHVQNDLWHRYWGVVLSRTALCEIIPLRLHTGRGHSEQVPAIGIDTL